MSDWTLTDPIGSIITELRAANIASKRVRGNEPGPEDAVTPYQRFVVIVDLGGPRLHRTPMQTVRFVIRCYGATYADASDLYRDVSDVLDNGGPRYGATGVALYQSLDESGGSAGKDPVTSQPFYEGTFQIFAGAQALAS